MTAFTRGAGRLPAKLAATRTGLHQVAEHILTSALHAATGEIALMPSPGGFRTPPFGRDGRFLAVDGTELVVAGTANYDVSPGDAQVADPYLYVGPHDGPPPGDPAFWNAPFGAARTIHQIGAAADAAAFFRDGRGRVLARAATP